MRVLLTVHQFFPDFCAGTEVLTLSVAQALIARGHEVQIFTGFPATEQLIDSERFDSYSYQGVPVDRFHHAYLPMGGQTSKIEIGYDNRLASNFFERLLWDFKPDVVHFFHLNRLGSGIIEKAVAARIPAFYTPTDFWSICPTAQLLLCGGKACPGPTSDAGNCAVHFASNLLGGRLGRLISRVPDTVSNALVRIARSPQLQGVPLVNEIQAINGRLERNVHRLNLLQGIIAPNKMIQDLLIDHGVRPDIVIRSAYGINLDQAVITRDRQVTHRPLQLGFIGTLASHKGCHILLQALQGFLTQDVTLRIYGKPTDFPEYTAQLHKLADGKPNIKFCGTFPNDQIFSVLGELDALIVPSVWNENTPLVVYSAQAAGCPVVASNVPGIAEAVTHGVDGLLFEPGSVRGLEESLRVLLDKPGFLGTLALNSKSPKSVSAYVDELLGAWQSSM